MCSYEQGQKVLTFEQDYTIYTCPDILMFGSSSIVEDEDECWSFWTTFSGLYLYYIELYCYTVLYSTVLYCTICTMSMFRTTLSGRCRTDSPWRRRMLSACTGGGATGSTSPRGPPSCDQTSVFSVITCQYLLFREFLNFTIKSVLSVNFPTPWKPKIAAFRKHWCQNWGSLGISSQYFTFREINCSDHRDSVH